MARPKIDPLEVAEIRLAERLKHENICKISTGVAPGCGTHKQARMVDHRKTQRSVEYYQQKITMLKNGGYSALNSSDRAQIRIAACLLAEHTDSMGAALPPRCGEVRDTYAASTDRQGLLRQWQESDWAAVGCLWLSGCKSAAIAQSILQIFGS